jgi:arylsulfatase
MALERDTRPNILLLMPDQWRWDWDGLDHGYEAPPLNLPNIERLRELGTTFPRGGVVPAPVCAPSRACMASLREYDYAGVATNKANDYKAKEIPTYFSALQRAGYHTMTTGKDDLTKATHLGYTLGKNTRNGSDTYLAKALGFSESFRFEGKGGVLETYPKPHEPFGYFLDDQMLKLSNGTKINAFVAHRYCVVRHDPRICETSTYPQDLYEDDWTAAHAKTLIKSAPSDKPWFLWVSFPGPHPPFAVTTSMENRTAGRSWPNPVDSKKKVPNCEENNHEPSNARTRCNYGAEMENLDRLFGEVLEAVHARGNSVEKDTIVCFFSDHGEMLNDHDDIDKSKPWQGALNVPLVCAGPGIQGNISLNVPVATIDIGATMLDFGNAWKYRDPKMTAKSFRGLLEGVDKLHRNRTIIHSGLQKNNFVGEKSNDNDVHSGARSFSFRLVVSEVNGPPMSTYKFICCKGRCPGAPSTVHRPSADGYTKLLFDTVADPFDMHDLKSKLPHIAEALRKELPVIHDFNCSSIH